MVALFDFACAAGYVGAVIEYEGNDDFRGFDGFLHGEEFFPQLLSRLGFSQQRRFGQGFGSDDGAATGQAGVGA